MQLDKRKDVTNLHSFCPSMNYAKEEKALTGVQIGFSYLVSGTVFNSSS